MKVEKKISKIRRKKKKQSWQRDQEQHVRQGWQRWTTYYRKESISFLKAQAQHKEMFVMDLLEEIINEYKNRV